MKIEFNLSDKINKDFNGNPISMNFLWEKDAREFIRLLKEEMGGSLIMDDRYNGVRKRIFYLINKLAGEKLTK